MNIVGLIVIASATLAFGWWLGRRRARGVAHGARDRAWMAELALAAAHDDARRGQILLDATGMAISDAVLHVDDQGRVRWATQAARIWFDIDLAARPTLMTAVRSVELQEMVDAAVADQSEISTVRIRDRTFRVGVVTLADGGAVIALRDDTELERLARARSDLVANVSHDIRTPLTSIGLLAESIAAPAFDDPSARAPVIAQIGDQLKSLAALADGMVELNQLESGRSLLRLRPESLAALAHAAVDGIAPQLSESGVRAVVEVAPDLAVLADARHIVRVFTNLLDNARRFSPRGATIRVHACAGDEPDRIEVAVTDEGPGIPPGDLDRIFERFYRGDRARTERSAGLGLAIARHIVTGHGGAIWAENNRGPGATVRFTLPGMG